ncbi:hypothetical protein KTG68_10975 [Acinetobacter variabilis]|uniref:Uncharacterized protein n=2 Tax=Acinetobacter TaxID=469 RepID=N9M8T2_9GAMM|nr:MULTISPECIES: hypothetical protein [Acinetobacter]AUX91441.1 hypothetical protein C3F22_17100 [Acinetobacter sp. ACNIH1]ENV00871.1 hypothetical protein F969_00184 [Acinetobacter variabilis]ENV14518.1 hypothetical protein F965_00179 [Acinetobacter schindleri NIPH 900]ENX04924.1 hypothetical protein F897_03410 [Acinetobacter variabilis]MBO3661771.1 hypothetical protein [Acinetobacter variabilis]
MMTPLLIDALTISEGRFKKPCPVLVLKMLLLDEETSGFSEVIKNQALLLLATYRKLLRAVARDLSNVKTIENSVKKRHWGKADKAQDKMVIADQLRLKHLDLEEMILFLNTQHFFKQLPISFVKKLVDWAPPVVSGIFLIENVLAGYIAQKLLLLEKIKVKELCKSVQPYFHIADFFVFLPRLEELYQKHQQQIVRVAPTAEVALALTDFKKAWIYRLRRRP